MKATVCEQLGLFIDNKSNHLVANQAITPLEFLKISQPSANNDRANVTGN